MLCVHGCVANHTSLPQRKTYLTAWHTLHAHYQVVPVVAALVPVSSLLVWDRNDCGGG